MWANVDAIARVFTFYALRPMVAARWGGVGPLVKYVGAHAVDSMEAMEKRGLYPALGTFKEVGGIMSHQLLEIVGYMDRTKKGPCLVSKKIQKMCCGPGTCCMER